jgi:hypothetical protein
LSEEFSLLPAQNMGACPGRTIDTALYFLVQQIYATWRNKDRMATLLSLHMTGDFDRVVPAWLLHNLSLLLRPESITFKMHSGESTIDLVFSTSDLVNSLTARCLRKDLDHWSDNYPLRHHFHFLLMSPLTPPSPCRGKQTRPRYPRGPGSWTYCPETMKYLKTLTQEWTGW